MSSQLILRVLAGVVGVVIAHRRGRDRIIWGLLSAFFPPLILMLLVLPPRVAPGRTRRCPYCSKILNNNDISCRYCKRELPIELVQCRGCGNFVPDKDYCMQCHRKLRD